MTVWYAQLDSTSVAAANMWNDAPDGSGNWLTWANLDPADVLCANNKATPLINVSFTCGAITNGGGGIGADGGMFWTQSGVSGITVTADVIAVKGICYRVDSTGTLSIVGDVTGGSLAGNSFGVWRYQLGGTTIITGTITGGSNTNCNGVRIDGAASNVLVVYGDVIGGSAATAYGVVQNTAGSVTINGNVTAGTDRSASGAANLSTGSLSVIGSLIDTEQCSAYAGKLYWQPVAGVHYHKVFHSAGVARYYSPSPADSDVRFGTFAGFSPSGVSYSGILALPAVANVRDGVFYDAYGTQEGTLALPAEADVKTGVGYGAGGEEFTGTLAAGGGGVPLIGPGGLVG